MIGRMYQCPSLAIAALLAALLTSSAVSRADSPIDPRLTALLDVAYENATGGFVPQTDRIAQLAALEVRAGRMDKARERMHYIRGHLAESTDNNLRPRLHLVSTYIALEEYEQAAEMLISMGSANSFATRPVSRQLILALDASGDHLAARRYARRLIPGLSDRGAVYADMAIQMLRRGEFDRAAAFVDDVLDLTFIPIKLDACMALAEEYHSRNQTVEAIRLLHRIYQEVQAAQLATEVHLMTTARLADCMRDLGELKLADQWLQAVIEQLTEIDIADFRYPERIIDLAHIFARFGERDRVLALLETLRSRDATASDKDRLALVLVLDHLRAGRLDLAQAEAQQHGHPHNDLLLSQHIRFCLDRGDIDAAFQTLEQLDKYSPHIESVTRYGGYMLVKHGHAERVDAWLNHFDGDFRQWEVRLGAIEALLKSSMTR